MSDCCPTKTQAPCHDYTHKNRFDYFLWGSSFVIAVVMLLDFINPDLPYIPVMAHTMWELFATMWWGIGLGILFVGVMAKMPKEYFSAVLGKNGSFGGIVRACVAGLFLDLCNHGILMVGAKLYERGVSTGQVMAFLIASPWNSLSLTFILIALIGLKWTLLFTALSAVIAIVTGLVFQMCEKRGVLPANVNAIETPEGFSVRADAKQRLKGFKLTPRFVVELVKESRHEAAMLLRWLLFSVVIVAATRAFVPAEAFEHLFGPTIMGLLATLGVATIIEVCSEGSAPIASEFMQSAKAPGNAFTFLMAGVSTDYTEILVMKDVTKSWKTALFIPLISVPQILVLGYMMNLAGG